MQAHSETGDPARRRLRLAITLILTAACLSMQAGSLAGGPTHPVVPPAQPETGPGGAARPFPQLTASRHGTAPTGYWLFEPVTADGASPDQPQPLVIFLHGFGAILPAAYGAWIEHIVRGGAVVIYPDYQTLNLFAQDPERYLPNVFSSVRSALSTLAQPGRTAIDPARVAVVGHSVGGVLAMNYAALAAAEMLPVPVAVMSVEPGGCRDCGRGPVNRGVPLVDLSDIPPDIFALIIVGEDDTAVGDVAARFMWEAMSSVPAGRRDYVVIRSDAHGTPALVADHLFPLTGGPLARIDALDWYGTWKLFDLLIACAFFEQRCEAAIGDTEAQRFMGRWSDGTPVRPAIITKEPATLEVLSS